MKKCFVIYNFQSGREKGNKYIDKVYEVLEKHGYETTIIYTKYRHHAEDIVYEIDEADLVISAGGDGTFNEVMTGNLKRKDPLLIANLPLGTTNDVGHMYGYKRNMIKNLEALLTGSIQNVDVCTINKKIFTYVASFGNFMNIAYDTPRHLKKKYGKLGYLIYGLKVVKDKLKVFDVSYKINGQEFKDNYSFIFITNSNTVAGVKDIYKDIKLNDDKFEVVLCELKSKRKLVKSLGLLGLKHIDEIPGFKFYQTNEFEIKIDDIKNTPWCIDGDKFESGETTFKFEIIKNVKLLVPNTNKNKLFIEKGE